MTIERPLLYGPHGDAIRVVDAGQGTLSPIFIPGTLDGDEVEAISDDHGMPTITFPHEQIHEGRMFAAGHLFTAVGAGADAEMHIHVGAKNMHLIEEISVLLVSTIHPFEDTTFTDNGTLLTNFNLKRDSGNTSDAKVYHTPSVDSDGTALPVALIPAALTVNRGAGIVAGGRNEWVLEAGKHYLLRVTNRGSQAQSYLNIEFVWYERENGN